MAAFDPFLLVAERQHFTFLTLTQRQAIRRYTITRDFSQR